VRDFLASSSASRLIDSDARAAVPGRPERAPVAGRRRVISTSGMESMEISRIAEQPKDAMDGPGMLVPPPAPLPGAAGPAVDEPPLDARSIGQQAGRGLRWSLCGNLVLRVGTFGMGLVLARLLSPADFGLFAIALAATYFVMHINDMGLIAAAVQWQGRFEDMAPTATTLAALFSIATYAVFWFLSPMFAELAGSAEATPVVRLLTAVILIDGLTAVRAAALMRRFQQDRLTMANLAGFLVQAVLAISLALNGAGAMSFAVGQVGGALVTGVLVFWLARVPVDVRVDREIARRLLRYGLPLAASLGVEAVLVNADYVIVGRMLGPAELGFYLMAFNVSSWVPSVIGSAVRYVSVAGFSRLAGSEAELAQGAQRTIPLLIAFVLPIAVIMGALATPLVVFLYGQRWAEAATVLHFLVILTVVRMVGAFAFDILAGAGASRLAFLLTLGWAVPLVPALVLGTHLGGIQGTAVAHAMVAVTIAAPLIALSLRRIGVSVGGLYRGGRGLCAGRARDPGLGAAGTGRRWFHRSAGLRRAGGAPGPPR
jgi:O-antigen/teichoic acid export membrane protein